MKDEIDRRAETDGLDRGRDMAETAGLRGDVEALPDVVEQPDDPHIVLHAVGRRIDADHRIANAEQQTVEQAGRDAAGIVGRMVRLQPGREPAGKPDRVAESGNDAAFGGDDDEILHAHDLRHGGDHLRGQAGGQCGQMVGRVRVSSSHSRNSPTVRWAMGANADRIMAVEDQAGNLVLSIGHEIDIQEGLERKIGQRHLGRDTLDRALRRYAGERIARAGGRGFGKQRLEIGESSSACRRSSCDRACYNA